MEHASMLAAGHAFFVTGNAVWLTDHVPAEYLSVLER
jgi:RNA:NAD 2'-phosphotransferase (TPT1/KptA family)